jgi:hypothetical protein
MNVRVKAERARVGDSERTAERARAGASERTAERARAARPYLCPCAPVPLCPYAPPTGRCGHTSGGVISHSAIAPGSIDGSSHRAILKS